MATYHFIPEEETFEKRLHNRLEGCSAAILASAFFTNGAFDAIKSSLSAALENGAKIQFLVGRFDFVTEPRAIAGLLAFSRDYPKQVEVVFDADFDFNFKLATFRDAENIAVIIGSSNLTPKGLRAIGEVNLEIIGNQSVYRSANKILQERMDAGIPAATEIENYRRIFKRARKFRRQHTRWQDTGRKHLTVRRRSVKPAQLEGNEFVFCWIDGTITDQKLKANLRKEYKNAQKAETSLPWQHVQWGGRTDARVFKNQDVFFVRDDIGKCFGFARIEKILFLLDGEDKEQCVVFYKYIRGRKSTFVSARKYKAVLAKLGLNGARKSIKSTYVNRLHEYFDKQRVASNK